MNDIQKKLLNTNLHYFIYKCFNTLNPGKEFADNWHIHLLSHYLEAVNRGKIKRLIINLPPRYLKSICTSVALPAWIIGRDPSKRVISASYSMGLSTKLSEDFRQVVNSSWYRHAFPEMSISADTNTKQKIVTSKRGFRMASSVGGTLTGEGGDILILDDPHNASEANSPTKRQKTIDWFESSFSTRLDSKKDGVIIIVMQRVHDNDLAGYLQKKSKNWEILNLPVIAEEEEAAIFSNHSYLRPQKEPLHNGLESFEEIDNLRKELGSDVFAAQYMQDPMLRQGSFIKATQLKFFDKPPLEFDRIIQSWDTAIKTGAHNDYSACITFGLKDNEYYIIDIFRAKLEYLELRGKIIDHASEFKADAILIEDKASGQCLNQDLKSGTNYQIVPIKVTKDKLSRFLRIIGYLESGIAIFPDNHENRNLFLKELLNFPGGAHDDMVDALTQGLNYLKDANEMPYRIGWI